MLRYKTETRPGLVALYDIRPGNGAGLFLQPWSPHGANITETTTQINKTELQARATQRIQITTGTVDVHYDPDNCQQL